MTNHQSKCTDSTIFVLHTRRKIRIFENKKETVYAQNGNISLTQDGFSTKLTFDLWGTKIVNQFTIKASSKESIVRNNERHKEYWTTGYNIAKNFCTYNASRNFSISAWICWVRKRLAVSQLYPKSSGRSIEVANCVTSSRRRILRFCSDSHVPDTISTSTNIET